MLAVHNVKLCVAEGEIVTVIGTNGADKTTLLDAAMRLVAKQNAGAALQVADEAYVLETGAVAFSGPARGLLHERRIIDTYLGLDGSHSPVGA